MKYELQKLNCELGEEQYSSVTSVAGRDASQSGQALRPASFRVKLNPNNSAESRSSILRSVKFQSLLFSGMLPPPTGSGSCVSNGTRGYSQSIAHGSGGLFAEPTSSGGGSSNMDEAACSRIATPVKEESFFADDVDDYDSARAQLSDQMHLINRAIKGVDKLIDLARVAPASASLEQAIIKLKGAMDSARAVAHVGMKLHQLKTAPDGSLAGVAQYLSVTAGVRHRLWLLLAYSGAVRSLLPQNPQQPSQG